MRNTDQWLAELAMLRRGFEGNEWMSLGSRLNLLMRIGELAQLVGVRRTDYEGPAGELLATANKELDAFAASSGIVLRELLERGVPPDAPPAVHAARSIRLRLHGQVPLPPLNLEFGAQGSSPTNYLSEWSLILGSTPQAELLGVSKTEPSTEDWERDRQLLLLDAIERVVRRGGTQWLALQRLKAAMELFGSGPSKEDCNRLRRFHRSRRGSGDSKLEVQIQRELDRFLFEDSGLFPLTHTSVGRDQTDSHAVPQANVNAVRNGRHPSLLLELKYVQEQADLDAAIGDASRQATRYDEDLKLLADGVDPWVVVVHDNLTLPTRAGVAGLAGVGEQWADRVVFISTFTPTAS